MKTKRNLKINSNSKSLLKNAFSFNPSYFIRPISKFWVSTLFREFMKSPMTLIFMVSFGLGSSKIKF
jgi:hypothetical protein